MMEHKQDVEALRREYSRLTLMEENIAANPAEQFAVWFRQALAADLPDANAMTLATANTSGKPSARIVLLKGFDQSGFRFYTNYQSRKGQELEENPQASACFFWSELERQIRIEGQTEKLSREESTAYFKKRPRLSKLGAWASSQSSEVDSRETLEQNFEKIKSRFEDKEIPVPDFWGGYLLIPARVEFWQGRPGRLHDRIVYSRKNDRWATARLSP
jgi:pyridoxamine 5'-phosphate oxidase